MQIIHLPIGWTIILDSLAWAILQPMIAYWAMHLPPSALNPQRWLFRPRRWEREGKIYEQLFLVKRWKAQLPSGGTVFAGGFSMKRIRSRHKEYLEQWTRETCRAEWTHWGAILVSGLFFMWNPPNLGLMMIGYAIVVNLPCIVTQRYNRPHLIRILHRLESPPTSS